MENIFGMPMGSLAVVLADPSGDTHGAGDLYGVVQAGHVPHRHPQHPAPQGPDPPDRARAHALDAEHKQRLRLRRLPQLLGQEGRLRPARPYRRDRGDQEARGAFGRTPFSEAIYGQVASKLAGNSSIDGYVPSLLSQAAVHFGARTEPGAQIMGVPADQTLQELRAQNGATLAGLKAGEVLINEKLATVPRLEGRRLRAGVRRSPSRTVQGGRYSRRTAGWQGQGRR